MRITKSLPFWLILISLTILGIGNMKQKKNKHNDDLDDGNNNGYFKEMAVFLSREKNIS